MQGSSSIDASNYRAATIEDWADEFWSIYEGYDRKRGLLETWSMAVEDAVKVATAIRTSRLDLALRSLAHTFGWILALSNKIRNDDSVHERFRIKALANLKEAIWYKYPQKCSTCLNRTCVCVLLGRTPPTADLASQDLALARRNELMPGSLLQWELMFQNIYGRAHEASALVCGGSLPVCDPTAGQHAGLSVSSGRAGVVDSSMLAVESRPQLCVEAGQTGQTHAVQILADRQDSLHLCLYALMGLGLCRSAPWMRKLSLVSIPDWYHAGGPFQIGHSLVVAPDCRCPAPVCGFIRPDLGIENSIPRYRQKVMISLWRKAQYTPAVVASRGPPSIP